MIAGAPYVRMQRAGEGHRYRRAWLEIEQVSGDDVEIDILGLTAHTARGPLDLVHHSVAFQTGTAPAGESFGDGVLAANLTAAGSDRWLMVHAAYHGTASSVTFTNTDSELWDSTGTPETEPLGHACASKVAPATSSTSYQATVASGSPDQLMIRIEQYTGVDQTTPTSNLSAEQSGGLSPASASPGATPDADDMVVDAAIAFADTLGSLGANQTDRNTTTTDAAIYCHGSDRLGSFGGGAMTRAFVGGDETVYGWLSRAFIVETAGGGGGAGSLSGFIGTNLRPNAFAPGLAR